MRDFIKYSCPATYLLYGVLCLFVGFIFIFSIFKTESFVRVFLIFLSVLSVFGSIAFCYYFFSNNRAKYILLKEQEIIIPCKWNNKIEKIKYSEVVNVEIVKYSSELFSRHEYNLLIETKSNLFYVEKSWIGDLDTLKYIQDSLHSKCKEISSINLKA